MSILKMFYDTETTGVNYKNCSIHQFSAILEIDNEIVETINLNMKPHEKSVFDEGAELTHGISKEQMLQYPAWEEQFKELKNTLKKYTSNFDKEKKFHMIGFKNASFDDFFLKKLFELSGDNFFFYFYASSIDVSCLAAEYLLHRRAKMPSFKLHRVAKELGIFVDDTRLHDGIYDCELTRQIYRIVTGREEEGLI